MYCFKFLNHYISKYLKAKFLKKKELKLTKMKVKVWNYFELFFKLQLAKFDHKSL